MIGRKPDKHGSTDLIDSVQMDPKVFDMHTKNGLLHEIRVMELDKAGGVRLHQAEERLLDFLRNAFKTVPPVASEKCAHCARGEREHERVQLDEGSVELRCAADGYFGCHFATKLVPAISQTPLAGSTVSLDRAFLRQHMPKLEAKFSYRSIDVSSLTELAKRWAPAVYESRPKAAAGAAHRALPDVRESIAYLRYYRERGFVASLVQSTSTKFQCPHPTRDFEGDCLYCGKAL